MSALYDRADQLLDAAKAALADNVPDRAFVTIGAPAWDTSVEGCAEQLTVSLLGLRVLQKPPGACAVQIQPTFSLVLLRCVTALTADGGIPGADALDLEAQPLADDALKLAAAITSAWSARTLFPGLTCPDVIFGDLLPQGPNGGLAGWRWDLTLTALV